VRGRKSDRGETAPIKKGFFRRGSEAWEPMVLKRKSKATNLSPEKRKSKGGEKDCQCRTAATQPKVSRRKKAIKRTRKEKKKCKKGVRNSVEPSEKKRHYNSVCENRKLGRSQTKYACWAFGPNKGNFSRFMGKKSSSPDGIGCVPSPIKNEERKSTSGEKNNRLKAGAIFESLAQEEGKDETDIRAGALRGGEKKT